MDAVCLIREERNGVITGKCGTSEKRGPGGLLPACFTAWTRDVTCKRCRGED